MEKLNKLGYTKVEVLIIVVLLGIVAFITINKTSMALSVDDANAVNEVKRLIEKQAEDYALDHTNELFGEVATTFISVDDLVDNGYLIANDDGLITDPGDPEKNFNNSKIKLEYNQDKKTVSAALVD